MTQAATARALLQRLYPWLGKAVHPRWTRRRSLYQSEVASLLLELDAVRGRLPDALRLRVHGFLAGLHREWFPENWRRSPTYAEILADFRWWLGVVERWGEPPPRTPRARRGRAEPLAQQPKELLKLLRLPADCTHKQFLARWRSFLKANHPDLNPDQTPEERRRFATAVGLWNRSVGSWT
jgi:hypothetical protein